MDPLAGLADLLGPQGRALAAGFTPYDAATAMARGAAARRDHPADLVAAAMTQARLRTQAMQRLGPQAALLWFTPAGLEQATRPVVAHRRAQHLAARGATAVADLGCGLGFDALAMAAAGLRVLAVERDPVTAAFAEANAAELGVADRITVVVGDATTIDAAAHGCDAVFVDPARRNGGRRVTDPEAWSPPWTQALAIASSTPSGCLKVAPGIAHDLPPTSATTEWVSDQGSLVEACVWLGRAADGDVRRRATVLSRDGGSTSVADTDLPPVVEVGELGTYLLEPDDAVIRAGLVGVVAQRVQGRLIDPAIAYVTCDTSPSPSPLYAAFRVVESMPFSLKVLRKRVHALGLGRVEVKKRGSAVDPEHLRKQLRLDAAATGSGVVLLTRIGRDPVAVIAQRVEPDDLDDDASTGDQDRST